MAKTTKQQVIENLTELMAKVQEAYFAGKMEGHPLWVHEHMDDTKGISIDLYHFEGDGLPVCEGLKPCKLDTIVAGENDEVFCMTFDPEWEGSKLKFIVSPETDECDYDVNPERLPQEALENITVWLQGQIQLGENDGYKIV